MVKRLLVILIGAGLFPSGLAMAAADAFQLKDGDRVVLVGNTLIEREQRYGYWETLLTSRYPDRNITFRNLGWSGDTVFGEAQAGFGSVADGFRHLKEHVLALKPTVILVGYGLNESFEGPAGLPKFTLGLNTLLDTLGQTKARMVLLTPLRHEDLGRPLPDPTEHNKNLQLYNEVLRKTAAQRGLPVVDFFQLLGERSPAAPHLTDNGIHLTAAGYWRAAGALEHGLGLPPPTWRIRLGPNGKVTAEGAKVDEVHARPLASQVTDAWLPAPLAPGPKGGAESLPGYERILHVDGLAPGRHTLTIDGQAVAEASAADWAKGVALHRGPEFDQVERLRAAIIEKNRQYFHRWRPQNETYLFGFRKHEQGQNAREIPQFDPLIARLERDIARLRVPAPHRYELILQRELKK
jgi:lysophospholipase L1-like esterase